MNPTVTVPATSPDVDMCPEHAWVFGPAGSKLITARGRHRFPTMTPNICPSTVPASQKGLTWGRRPYMSTFADYDVGVEMDASLTFGVALRQTGSATHQSWLRRRPS